MFPHAKVIVFDAVGTLIRPHRSVAQIYHEVGCRHGFGLSPATIALRFPVAFQRQEAVDAEAGTWATDEQRELERWRAIVNEVFEGAEISGDDVHCDDVRRDKDRLFADLWEHYSQADHWHVYEDVAPTLDHLARRNVTIGVASNLDSRLEYLSTRLGSLERCQHWFISSRVGFRKPGSEFFQRVEQSLGFDAEQIVMVGDDPRNDIEGAQRCGWNAVLVDRKLNRSSNGVLRDLTDLLALLPG